MRACWQRWSTSPSRGTATASMSRRTTTAPSVSPPPAPAPPILTRALGPGTDMESFCAGGVFSWAKRSSYGWGGGAAGDGGMIASSHTQGRPNLSRFLCRYAQKERPGFDFTSIQVVRRDTFVSRLPSR